MGFCSIFKKNPTSLLVFLGLQTSVITALCIASPGSFINFDSVLTIIFWLLGVVTLGFYLKTHLMDPGFVPYDSLSTHDDHTSVFRSSSSSANSDKSLESCKAKKGQPTMFSKDGKPIASPKMITAQDLRNMKEKIEEQGENPMSDERQRNDDNGGHERLNESHAPPCEQSFNIEISQLHDDLPDLDVEPSKDNDTLVVKESTQPETNEDDKHAQQQQQKGVESTSAKLEGSPATEKMLKSDEKQRDGYLKHNDLEDKGSESTRPLEIEKNGSVSKLDIDYSKRSHIDLVVHHQDRNIESPADYYVERRYCMACNLEQPFRSKHCKDCSRCIAMYDHHCPWLGTCIGEKNHCYFLVYLFFQTLQLGEALYKTMASLIAEDTTPTDSLPRVLKIGSLVIIIFFSFMVVSLLFYHLYLMCANLSTWEHASWYKISYLKEFDEDEGSPFDHGCVKNVRLFCLESQKPGIINWKFTRVPKKVTPASA